MGNIGLLIHSYSQSGVQNFDLRKSKFSNFAIYFVMSSSLVVVSSKNTLTLGLSILLVLKVSSNLAVIT